MSPEARLAEAKVHPLERDQTSLTAVQNFAYQPARSRETYGNTQYALGKGVSPLPPRGGGDQSCAKILDEGGCCRSTDTTKMAKLLGEWKNDQIRWIEAEKPSFGFFSHFERTRKLECAPFFAQS